MRRDCDVVNSTGDDNYHTLELAGTLIPDPPLAPDFRIEVDHDPAIGADLTKINQPNKNVALVDKIFIAPIDYFEIVSP